MINQNRKTKHTSISESIGIFEKFGFDIWEVEVIEVLLLEEFCFIESI